MPKALINGQVLLDGALRQGLAVVIEDDVIASIVSADLLPAMDIVDLSGDLLLPGFIDIQVNGGGGALFNDQPTVETIEIIGRAHRQYGTTGFMPTLISDDLDNIDRAMRAVEAAMARNVPGVLGLHIEGPYLNPGRRGVHRAEKLRTFDAAALELLTSMRCGKTIVTLAPEIAGLEAIRGLVRGGVIVALGHSNADYDVSTEAFAAGATGVTHLFNGMAPMTSRSPGLVAAVLDNPEVWAGVIVDGHHVAPSILGIALRASRSRRFMLVTDAMPSVGTDLKTFTLQGQEVTVHDGVCLNAEQTLAGAHLNMMQAVSNTVHMLGQYLPDAVAMASGMPAAFLGLNASAGAIAVNHRADLVRATPDFRVKETWIQGCHQIHQA